MIRCVLFAFIFCLRILSLVLPPQLPKWDDPSGFDVSEVEGPMHGLITE